MARAAHPGGRTRYGLIAAGVMVVALLAGGAVAGLPDTVPDDIEPTDIQPVTTATVAPLATKVDEAAPTTSETVPSSVAPLQSTQAISATTTTTTTTTAPVRPPAAVRVVVANGAAADGIASSVAADLRNVGYADVVATNAVARRPTSVVYYAVGYDREAGALAATLGIAATESQPVEAITTSSTASDLWVVLGADRI